MTELQRLRTALGISRERLAQRAEVSERTIYSAEIEGRTPMPATKKAIAGALGCEVEDVWPAPRLPEGLLRGRRNDREATVG
jgi:DNA-binding XRE family transcriptional regulator